MAASDPTTGVPTPRGTLQGLAAFSWDGANWQPAGRAMPSVATPTGVLRGVAPFSWDGANWQPTGKAMPSVATPSGVLDGVAVYTWNGSAWTPTGGAPDVPTPSGTLQGIAAFNWDGTAWQPSGQAAAEVPTSYGVLQGAAMFSWGGSTWAPTVAGVTLDISFLNTTTLDARVAFTRASTATYFDANGVMQTAAVNVPRFDNDPVTHAARGLLMEGSQTNSLLNSATLGTQSVAVTAQAYTLSFYGTGTVTMSGAFAGSLVGTGAFPARASQTFTPAAGTLTLTVTGSVLNAQLEAGSFPTSYIPTTGAAVTRAVDVATMTSVPGRNPTSESFEADFVLIGNAGLYPRIVGGANQPYGMLIVNNTNGGGTYDAIGLLGTSNSIVMGAVSKVASTWASPNAASVCLNGGPVASSTALTGGFAGTPAIEFMGDGTVSDVAYGYIRRFRYWPRVLSNSELQQVTT